MESEVVDMTPASSSGDGDDLLSLEERNCVSHRLHSIILARQKGKT